MKSLVKRIISKKITKNILLLSGGALVTQAVSLTMMPVLTRLYGPEQFGKFSLFVAIFAMIAPVVCLKYEAGIIITNSLNEVKELIRGSLVSTTLIMILALIAVYKFDEISLTYHKYEILNDVVIYIPLLILFSGVLTFTRAYSNHNENYKDISKSRVYVAVVYTFTAAVLGVFSVNNGLMYGYVFSTVLVCLLMVYKLDIIKLICEKNGEKGFKETINKYKDLPLYNAPTSLLNAITTQMPVLFLAAYFPVSVVGIYAIMLRVSILPIRFLSNSVRQVNLKHVSVLKDQNKSVFKYIIQATLVLVSITLPTGVIISHFADDIFSIVFGEEWKIAGLYLQILMPAIIIKFIVSTLSNSMIGIGKIKVLAYWRIFAFVTSFIVLYRYVPQGDIIQVLNAIMLLDVSIYSFYYVLLLVYSNKASIK